MKTANHRMHGSGDGQPVLNSTSMLAAPGCVSFADRNMDTQLAILKLLDESCRKTLECSPKT